jgi:hypothetical protein
MLSSFRESRSFASSLASIADFDSCAKATDGDNAAADAIAVTITATKTTVRARRGASVMSDPLE